MGSGISPRTLQFYNNETVFGLNRKQTTFLGAPHRIESLSAMGYSPDVFRYLTGLARYKTTSEGGDVTIGNIAEFDERVTITSNSIEFDESFQFEYRIPFWKIEFVGEPMVRPDGEDENALFCEALQDIKYYFRSLNWVKIFFSENNFNEFLERGNLLGPIHNHASVAAASETTLMEKCEETISKLMRGTDQLSMPVRFVKRPPGMLPEEIYYNAQQRAGSVSPTYSDLNISTLAQVPETLIRLEKEKNLEAVCDLRFIVDENYNFLSREFEFGERAPSNRFYTGFEESLMPSSYNYSIIKYFENGLVEGTFLEDYVNLLKRVLFFGPFNLEPYETSPLRRGSRVGELTRDLYNKFGQSIKNLSSDRFELAYGDEEEQQRRRIILIDPMISQDYNFQSLFPFGNRIEITDVPTAAGSGDGTSGGGQAVRARAPHLLRYLVKHNLETDMMLNLMNGTATLRWSTLKKLSITDYFTGRPTTSGIRNTREFDFVEIFNNSSQLFNIDEDTKTLIGELSPGQDSDQVEKFNSEFTTPYLSGLNLKTFNFIDADQLVEAFIEFQDTLRDSSFNSIPDLKGMLLSEKNNYFEIFAYKVVKRNTSTSATQQFFIFNRPEGIVEFFDTQVKPNQEYEYSLSALTFVLENTYRYEMPPADDGTVPGVQFDVDLMPVRSPADGSTNDLWNPLNPEADRYVLGANIRTRQLPKIIELPLTSEKSVLTDMPPARPNVDFYPVKDFNDRVKIRVSSMNATEDAMPVVIENGDFALFTKIRQSQKVKSNEKIKFSSDETPAAFEVFRLDHKPETIRDFIGRKRVIRSVTSEDRSTDGTSFMDDIVTNVDYYYLFRTLDFHGHISNPTEVFKFTLVDNEGALQPLLVTISLEEMFGTLKADGRFRKLKKDTNSKEVRRFIKIRPNPQEISFVRGQFDGKASEDVSSVQLGRGALPSSEDPDKIESQNNIIDQRYMLELKSKKTGKSIFIEFKYVLNNFNIATLERRTIVPDTVTEQDIQDALARRNEGDPEMLVPDMPLLPAGDWVFSIPDRRDAPGDTITERALENIREKESELAGPLESSESVIEDDAAEGVADTGATAQAAATEGLWIGTTD